MRKTAFMLSITAVALVAVALTAHLQVDRPPSIGHHVADTASLSIASGLAPNMCCEPDSDDCYGGPMSQGNCTGPLPWQCYCTNPGITTWIINAINTGEHCVATTLDKSCDETTAEDCYQKANGVCDDDGGGWSLGGFCWVCGPGSLIPGNWQGDYTVCTDASSDCGPIPEPI